MREFLKDTDSITLYKNMRETLGKSAQNDTHDHQETGVRGDPESLGSMLAEAFNTLYKNMYAQNDRLGHRVVLQCCSIH